MTDTLDPPDHAVDLVARFDCVGPAMTALRAWFSATDHPAATADAWEMALVEALNNVIEHGYPDRMDGRIRLELWLAPESLRLVIHDHGHPMPTGQPPASGMPSAVCLPEGGFGWPMIHALCSDVSYARHGDGNRLGLVIPLP